MSTPVCEKRMATHQGRVGAFRTAGDAGSTRSPAGVEENHLRCRSQLRPTSPPRQAANPGLVHEPTSRREAPAHPALQPFADNPKYCTATPVTLPPGRLRLVTRPSPTGSGPPMKTIGIAAFAARADTVPPVAAIKDHPDGEPGRPPAPAAAHCYRPPNDTRSRRCGLQTSRRRSRPWRNRYRTSRTGRARHC